MKKEPDADLALMLLIFSSALSLSVVALGLTAIGRCLGTVPLEILPFGIGLSLILISQSAATSTATLSGSDLLAPILGCGISVFGLHPFYVRWRLRLGGESMSLMFSFALMTFWLQVLSVASNSKSITPAIPEFLSSKEYLGLKVISIAASLLALTLAGIVGSLRGNLAALQLSLGDSRLLVSFGLRTYTCQLTVLVSGIIFTTVGSLIYICLQQNFSFQNSYDIIIPAFAISLTQTRIRIFHTVISALFLLSGIEFLTRVSSDATTRELHQAVLFGVIVVLVLGRRVLTASGILDLIERKFQSAIRVRREAQVA